MKCEGDKTYDQPGTCPVCEMYLVPVGEGDNEDAGMNSDGINEGAPSANTGKYYCPMKCEGDKTYDQPGTCPVCEMYLVPVEDNESASGRKPAAILHPLPEIKKRNKPQEEKTTEQVQYYCPMKCEGNKVYDEPGRCPVCYMKLIPVGTTFQSPRQHEHDHHHEHVHGSHSQGITFPGSILLSYALRGR